MVAALTGPVYTSAQTLGNAPKVPFSATVQLVRRGVGSAELVRQVASRQVDRDWRVPRRAIQKARGTLTSKSATSSPPDVHYLSLENRREFGPDPGQRGFIIRASFAVLG